MVLVCDRVVLTAVWLRAAGIIRVLDVFGVLIGLSIRRGQINNGEQRVDLERGHSYRRRRRMYADLGTQRSNDAS